MKGWMVALAAIALALGGCDDKGSAPAPAAAAKKAADKRASETTAKPGVADPHKAVKAAAAMAEGAAAAAPLEGPGPHEGFDLKAIHAKLQGTWLIGGSAFSRIPHIWDVKGDLLTIVDGTGQSSEHTFRLLAPCHMVTADGGGSRTWHKFVFDGDTLYSGLGNAGLKQGDTTVGCMAAGAYVLKGGTCTKWTKKAFAKAGTNPWESEPGECGYEADGKTFFGDDTHSKRKTYGKERLDVVGAVLLTKQMAGNKAVKAESLEAAMTAQKAKIDAKEALNHPPKDLVYKDWKLPKVEAAAFEKGKTLWATGVDREGKWRTSAMRYSGLNDAEHKLYSAGDRWAPAAFIADYAEPKDLAKGAPLMVASGFLDYGRFVESKDTKVSVAKLAGNGAKPRDYETLRSAALTPGEWQLGSPAACKEGDTWQGCTIVAAVGEAVFVNTREAVESKPKADVKLVDIGTIHKQGAKVLAQPRSGMGTLAFEPATVTEVHEGGAAYTVKTDAGKVFTQSFHLVMSPQS